MEEKISKPLITLALIFILTVLTAFIPASWFGIKPVEKHYTKLNIATADDLVALQGDANKNGTSDWRELLQNNFQADANSAKITVPTKVDPEVQKRLDDPNNLTSSFSKNMYVANAYLKEKGITDPATQQTLIENIVKGEEVKIAPRVYTEPDLAVSTNESKAALTVYGNALGEILTLADKYKFAQDDLIVVDTFNKSKKPSDLAPLIKKATNADSVIKKMLAISVPKSAAATHLVALNRLSAYKTIIESLSKADTDPVRAVLALKQYQSDSILLVKSIYRFADYFVAHQVTFTKTDKGYFFTSLYKNIQ